MQRRNAMTTEDCKYLQKSKTHLSVLHEDKGLDTELMTMHRRDRMAAKGVGEFERQAKFLFRIYEERRQLKKHEQQQKEQQSADRHRNNTEPWIYYLVAKHLSGRC